MPTYSIAEAKDQLPRLVDEALAGESVTITRDGEAVVELRAKEREARRTFPPGLIDRIAADAKRLPLGGESAAEIVRAMRDDFD